MHVEVMGQLESRHGIERQDYGCALRFVSSLGASHDANEESLEAKIRWF
jgi:hypothetical protein